MHEHLKKLENNVILFGKVIAPSMFSLPSPSFHYDLADIYHNPEIDRTVIQAPRGHAKAESIDSLLLTCKGWKRFEEIEVGDYAIGSNGKPTKVVAIHPIGEMELYRVTTRDGRTVLCNKEHLWSVTCPSNTGNKVITKSTAELMDNYKSSRYDKRNGESYTEYRYFIDTVAPIEFPEKELLVDPYTLGAWLGDGTSTGGSFTTADEEMLTYFPYTTRKRKAPYLYSLLGLQKQLRSLGVLRNKHIPQDYLFASKEQRIRLLQGLIDTDGSISSDGMQISFVNTNHQLFASVVDLIRSLGGTVTVGDQWTRFNKSSEYKFSYRLTARLPEGIVPVRLSRKLKKWKGSIKTKSAIVSIEFEKMGLGRCITVANEDGLYVTDDYLITHNSSLVAGVFPLHHLMFFPGTKVIMLVSRTEGHCIRLLNSIKDILDYSESFRQIFGYWGKHSAKSWKEQEIELKDGSLIVARGMNQQIVGLKHKDQRPTLTILDDPEDETNTKTPESMEINLRALLKVILPGRDPQKGRLFVIGTPQRAGCMVEVLKDMTGWESRKYDAIVDEAAKKTLWPELWPWDKLMQEKEALEAINRTSIFYSEYRCQIIGDEDQLFKPEYMRYWDGKYFLGENGEAYVEIQELGEPVKENVEWEVKWRRLSEPEIVPINVFMGVDPASSIKQSADYSCIMPIGVDKEERRFVLPFFKARVSPMALAENIISKYLQYKPKKTTIETIGYQEMIRDYLTSDEVRKKRNLHIPGLEYDDKTTKPRESKSVRLESLEPLFANHKVYLKKGMSDFENELFLYPRTRKSPDMIDAFYYANSKVWTPYHTKNTKLKSGQVSKGQSVLDSESWAWS